MTNKPLIGYSKNKWIILIILSGFMGGISAVIITYYFTQLWFIHIAAFMLGSGSMGGIFLTLALLDKNSEQLSKQIDNNFEAIEQELKASINIRPFTTYHLKLGTRKKGYAATAHFLERIVMEIVQSKPKLIVECGSGSSTIAIAGCLKNLGKGTIISLEHDGDYAEITRKYIEAEAFNSRAEVITAPLKSWQLSHKSCKWYNFDLDKYLTEPIDMLIVDGPPGDTREMARYPAVPILKDYLSQQCVIIVDDTNRNDERQTAQAWTSLLNANAEVIKEGRGYWIIRK